MDMFDRFIKTEDRSLGNPNVPVFADDFFAHHGLGRQKMYFFNALNAGAGNPKNQDPFHLLRLHLRPFN